MFSIRTVLCKATFYSLLLYFSVFIARVNSLPKSNTSNSVEPRSIANGVSLRILPLGDSITWGLFSTSGDGYRQNLQDLLAGNEVHFSGSQLSGTMKDKHNEGHPGARISEIAEFARWSLPERPNVVLLMAGTNDVAASFELDMAPARLRTLIDEVLAACPDAALIVAQILPISVAADRVLAYNKALLDIVAERAAGRKQILAVDMSGIGPESMADGLHPNDHGYSQMADVWMGGIQEAASNGWIKPPVPGAPPDKGGSCIGDLYWDDTWGVVATGASTEHFPETGPFEIDWIPVGQLASGPDADGFGDNFGDGVRLADLDGDGRLDYVWVHPDNGDMYLYVNSGFQPSNDAISWIRWGIVGHGPAGGGDGAGAMFADLNGDGLADYIYVSKSGDVSAYINRGPGRGGPDSGTWIWESIGIINDANTYGSERGNIIFADIDGDGRDEFLIVGDGGKLTAWLNSGNLDAPRWESMGVIATGPGGGVGDAAGVYLADLNNDGRADYIWLDKSGKATAFLNHRSQVPGLIPQWVPLGLLAIGVGQSRDHIRFGDINSDGKAEYIYIEPKTGAMSVWINAGSGGSEQESDSIFFADMNGDGREDYLVIDKFGAVTCYVNGGDVPNHLWNWHEGVLVTSGFGHARKDIRSVLPSFAEFVFTNSYKAR
jgi:lysophospholipase L1-like esterase